MQNTVFVGYFATLLVSKYRSAMLFSGQSMDLAVITKQLGPDSENFT